MLGIALPTVGRSASVGSAFAKATADNLGGLWKRRGLPTGAASDASVWRRLVRKRGFRRGRFEASSLALNSATLFEFLELSFPLCAPKYRRVPGSWLAFG